MFCSDDPEHIKYARELARAPHAPVLCYQFVNEVLEKSANNAYRELLNHLEEILPLLPEESRAKEFIPYFYFLLPFEKLHHWRKIEITDIQAGDLLVYKDKDYDPNPAKRSPSSSPKTHISFISDADITEITLLESSKRTKERHLYNPNSGITPNENYSIAYSSLYSVSTDQPTGLSVIKIKGYKPIQNKLIYILRIMNHL